MRAARGWTSSGGPESKVEVGLCEEEARLLNAPFFKYAATGKCWVVLKWAQSIDGKLAYADQSPVETQKCVVDGSATS